MRSPLMVPRAAIVDPTLTLSCPRDTTAASGLDCITQLVEAFICRFRQPLPRALVIDALPRAVAALPQVINTPELRFDCPDTRKFEVVAEVKQRLAAAGTKVQDVDGVRVLTEDGWWLLRASNTQAVLVARAEASSEAGLERLKAQIAGQLQGSGLQAPDFSGENAGH
jgi:hypothetical protein